jgi:uncharacterized protein YoxC
LLPGKDKILAMVALDPRGELNGTVGGMCVELKCLWLLDFRGDQVDNSAVNSAKPAVDEYNLANRVRLLEEIITKNVDAPKEIARLDKDMDTLASVVKGVRTMTKRNADDLDKDLAEIDKLRKALANVTKEVADLRAAKKPATTSTFANAAKPSANVTKKAAGPSKAASTKGKEVAAPSRFSDLLDD